MSRLYFSPKAEGRPQRRVPMELPTLLLYLLTDFANTVVTQHLYTHSDAAVGRFQ